MSGIDDMETSSSELLSVAFLETETDDGMSRNSISSIDGGEGGKKVRGNYKCQFCNVPKKGHVCPFQKVYKRATEPVGIEGVGAGAAAGAGTETGLESSSLAIQVELGGVEMTTRVLDLSAQGTAASYVTILLAAGSASASVSASTDYLSASTESIVSYDV